MLFLGAFKRETPFVMQLDLRVAGKRRSVGILKRHTSRNANCTFYGISCPKAQEISAAEQSGAPLRLPRGGKMTVPTNPQVPLQDKFTFVHNPKACKERAGRTEVLRRRDESRIGQETNLLHLLGVAHEHTIVA